ncbi:MAG: hypothetical protein HC772_15665 [Leptolyngbyaceae cyanobacterium CRU_2_3]|nr:hypothetical protein [Leptolyngbyaceae cyanobacterium CRU_2_3]
MSSYDVSVMQELVKDAATDVADLLTRFSFDLNGFTVDILVSVWLSQYPADWVRFSLVEALYQGRYKAVSVEQILRFWQRRGQPIYHFNHEFERIIRGRFSRNLLTSLPQPVASLPSRARVKHSNIESQPALRQLDELPSFIEPVEPVEPVEPADVAAKEESGLPEAGLPETGLPESEMDSSNLSDLPESTSSEGAIQSFSDRLKLLSSEESLAFLKLRSFEQTSQPISRDLPIQAFKPIIELQSEAIAQPKWVKLAVSRVYVEEIHQFVPNTEAPPEFYGKLKAVVSASIDPEDVG